MIYNAILNPEILSTDACDFKFTKHFFFRLVLDFNGNIKKQMINVCKEYEKKTNNHRRRAYIEELLKSRTIKIKKTINSFEELKKFCVDRKVPLDNILDNSIKLDEEKIEKKLNDLVGEKKHIAPEAGGVHLEEFFDDISKVFWSYDKIGICAAELSDILSKWEKKPESYKDAINESIKRLLGHLKDNNINEKITIIVFTKEHQKDSADETKKKIKNLLKDFQEDFEIIAHVREFKRNDLTTKDTVHARSITCKHFHISALDYTPFELLVKRSDEFHAQKTSYQLALRHHHSADLKYLI